PEGARLDKMLPGRSKLSHPEFAQTEHGPSLPVAAFECDVAAEGRGCRRILIAVIVQRADVPPALRPSRSDLDELFVQGDGFLDLALPRTGLLFLLLQAKLFSDRLFTVSVSLHSFPIIQAGEGHVRVDESGLAFYNVFQHPSSLIQFPAAHADETDLESHRAVTGAALHGF